MPKAKIPVTIDEDLAKEMDSYFRKPVAEAAKSGKPFPKISNVYEEIVSGDGMPLRKRLRSRL